MDQNTDVDSFAMGVSNILDAICGTKYSYVLIVHDMGTDGETAVVSPVPKEQVKSILEEISSNMLVPELSRTFEY